MNGKGKKKIHMGNNVYTREKKQQTSRRDTKEANKRHVDRRDIADGFKA